MRNVWITRAAALTLTLLAIAGCNDTQQPDGGGSKTASVLVDARAQDHLYDCYDIFQAQPDGSEVDTGYNVCDQLTGDGSEQRRAVPWRYTMSISVIRAG